MPDPDYKALCKELVEAYAYLIDRYMTAPSNKDALVYRARADLAQPEPQPPAAIVEMVNKLHQINNPAIQPVAPTDEELDEFAVFWWGSDTDERTVTDVIECCSMTAYARAVLARWGTPANNTREEN
jgi:hypothetical protein